MYIEIVYPVQICFLFTNNKNPFRPKPNRLYMYSYAHCFPVYLSTAIAQHRIRWKENLFQCSFVLVLGLYIFLLKIFLFFSLINKMFIKI